MSSDGLRILRVLVAVGACVYAPGATAQSEQLSPAALGRIVDAAILEIIPPQQLISRVAVADRGVFFDHRRTVACERSGRMKPASSGISTSRKRWP